MLFLIVLNFANKKNMYFYYVKKEIQDNFKVELEKNSLNLNLKEIFVPSSLFPHRKKQQEFDQLWTG
jgi:hypothetical protein